MGCGKSKHDIATGNTTNPKKLKINIKKSEGLHIVPGTSTSVAGIHANSSEKRLESEITDKNSDQTLTISNVKDIPINEVSKGRDSGNEKNEEVAVFISRDSPDLYFSSRKDGDTIEIAVAGDETLGFCTPYYDPNHEEEERELKGLLLDEEKLGNANNGASLYLKEPIMIEATKVVAAVEGKTVTFIED